jgi:hypothetical protein
LLHELQHTMALATLLRLRGRDQPISPDATGDNSTPRPSAQLPESMHGVQAGPSTLTSAPADGPLPRSFGSYAEACSPASGGGALDPAHLPPSVVRTARSGASPLRRHASTPTRATLAPARGNSRLRRSSSSPARPPLVPSATTESSGLGTG